MNTPWYAKKIEKFKEEWKINWKVKIEKNRVVKKKKKRKLWRRIVGYIVPKMEDYVDNKVGVVKQKDEKIQSRKIII